MALSTSMVEFVERVKTLQQHRDSTDNLLRDILIYCEHIESSYKHENNKLTDQLRDCTLDLTDATNSRRDLQQRLQSAQVQNEGLLKQNDDLKNRNPYILLLIDGDGLIFQEKWIRQGVDGGKKAAYALRSAIAEQFGHLGDGVEIVTKVVANVMGLAKALHREGSIENITEFRDFTLGFTQAKASFDFIDVGYGKERADSKIKEITRWNLENHNCKHILLGISHDSGYAPFLDEILRDDITRERLTVVEGSPIVNELLATKVSKTSLGQDIFRVDKLIDRQPVNARATSAPSAPPRLASPAPSSSSGKTPASTSTASYAGITSSASPPPSLSLPIPPVPKQHNTISRPKQQYVTIPPQQPDWNPRPRGLDEPITVSVTALEAIRKRKGTQNLCNNHYLRGPCAKRDVCLFVHNYKATEEELNAIACLSRQNPCANGQYCDVENCIYGHHCPSIKDRHCTHPNCKFKVDDHPPGTKFRSLVLRP